MPAQLHELATGTGNVARGVVAEILQDGTILVDMLNDAPRRTLCDFLQTSDWPTLELSPHDEVLILLPDNLEERGCILGRIGPYTAPKQPEHVVIDAKRELTLNCGDSSLSMRRDGKVLLKGVDVVSRAKRTNKLKGGSVDIN